MASIVRPLTRNQQQVRDWLSPYDMLVFLGSDQLRMSVHSPVEPLPDGVRVVQIGNRDWELAKNYPAEIALKADVKETLQALLPVLRKRMSAEEAAQAAQRLAAGDVQRAPALLLRPRGTRRGRVPQRRDARRAVVGGHAGRRPGELRNPSRAPASGSSAVAVSPRRCSRGRQPQRRRPRDRGLGAVRSRARGGS